MQCVVFDTADALGKPQRPSMTGCNSLSPGSCYSTFERMKKCSSMLGTLPSTPECWWSTWTSWRSPWRRKSPWACQKKSLLCLMAGPIQAHIWGPYFSFYVANHKTPLGMRTSAFSSCSPRTRTASQRTSTCSWSSMCWVCRRKPRQTLWPWSLTIVLWTKPWFIKWSDN